jgi:prepilin-type processing-associated H-X9-DG protein
MSPSLSCLFCGRTSHAERDCRTKLKASQKAKGVTVHTHKRGTRGRGRGEQKTKDVLQEDSHSFPTTHSAGHASAQTSTQRTAWLQTRAATDWNTDTGATSHMTPHRHWFRSYSKHVVPIRLADSSIIYSAGIGSVEFQPMKGGIVRQPVVFHDVLHVPDLASNLLALLHLTRTKGYKVTIEGNELEFIHAGETRFTATVTDANIGYLDGHALIPQSANSTWG